MGDGIFPDEATISVVAADVAGSLVVASDAITGDVSNYSETGGDKEMESIAVFGGGNIDKENPRGQVEISFDVEMQYGTGVTKWDIFKYGAGLTSATEGTAKAIYIQWNSGSDFYTRAYNNAKGITWNPTSAADGNLKGTMTFKLSPTTSTAAANVQIVALAASTLNW